MTHVATQEGGFMHTFRKLSKLKKVLIFTLSLILIFVSAVCTQNIDRRVKVTDGSTQLVLNTYTANTTAILSQADIALDTFDEVERKDSGDTIYIKVKRAFPVHITYHNLEHIEFMTGGTVSDALAGAGLTLSVDDVINYSGDTEVFDGMKIVIDEVKYIKKTDTKTLKRDTKVESSDDYPQGYEEVISNGRNGKSQITTTYKYVNGEFSGVCGKISEVVTTPKSKVVLKGTAQTAQVSNITTVGNTNSNNSTSTSGTISGMSYSKVLKGSATAYTASSGALTSTGVPAYVGGVAVNPNVIPYGSKLYIVADGYTYGYATAVDTGGALMDGSALVDLYMSTYDECINFGRRNVTVYVLS